MDSTYVLIASGPSANARDARILASTGARVVCVNNAWSLVPDCEAVYAGDDWWWQTYGSQVPATAYRVSAGRRHQEFGCEFDGPFSGVWCSGLKALEWVIRQGGTRIILLGFDCRAVGGALHFHPDHAGANPRPQNMESWAILFDLIADTYPGIEIINACPDSAIRAFERMTVASAIDRLGLTVNRKSVGSFSG